MRTEQILLKCWPERCTFLMLSHHWKTIDKNCPVSVNVYGYEKGTVFPLFLSVSWGTKPFHVDVLFCNGHYCLIRNLAALISPQMKANHCKCYICPSFWLPMFLIAGTQVIWHCVEMTVLCTRFPHLLTLHWLSIVSKIWCALLLSFIVIWRHA